MRPATAYGDTPRERLDMFLAADPQAPTLAFIHGGYWQMSDKESYAFFAEGLLPLGINLAVIEYTLAPAARLDRIVAEVRRGVRWLAQHLVDYGADPDRLYVSGHSAGGHLTAMDGAPLGRQVRLAMTPYRIGRDLEALRNGTFREPRRDGQINLRRAG
jgi:arylformamidase